MQESENGAILPWMRGRVPEGLREVERPGRMRIGLSEMLWGENGRELGFVQDTARLVEELGYDTVWLPEHIVKFAKMDSYHPYAGKRWKAGWEFQTRGQLDSPITAVAIAAVTKRIRIGTYVTILGQRHPVMFAHEIATVDHLTGGRFNLGVGVGWAKEEYEALGTSFDRRGARVDEYLEAMRNLWTEDSSEYHGEFADFGPLLAYPKPLQRPHPPVLVGGQSLQGIERAAKHGDGLIIYNLDLPEVQLCLEEYDRALARHGRRLEDVWIVVGRRNVAGDAYQFGKPLPETEIRAIWEADARFLEGCHRIGANPRGGLLAAAPDGRVRAADARLRRRHRRLTLDGGAGRPAEGEPPCRPGLDRRGAHDRRRQLSPGAARWKSVARWNARPSRRHMSSRCGGAMTWTPMGMPRWSRPAGRARAGTPRRSNTRVVRVMTSSQG